jgi:Cu-Zn family superoxide dismutase
MRPEGAAPRSDLRRWQVEGSQMKIDIHRAGLVLSAGLIATTCTRPPRDEASATASPSPAQPGASATAPPPAAAAEAGGELAPTQDSRAQGTVGFATVPGGLRVTARLEGLPPGEHGFHLHEKPDCSAPDASSAGEHWNPTSQQHGSPDVPPHHAGDLGNITADASGVAQVDRVVSGLTLEGGQSVVGRSAVVHARRDDLTTQPSGDSGARLACGVVARGGGALSVTRPRDPGD